MAYIKQMLFVNHVVCGQCPTQLKRLFVNDTTDASRHQPLEVMMPTDIKYCYNPFGDYYTPFIRTM